MSPGTMNRNFLKCHQWFMCLKKYLLKDIPKLLPSSGAVHNVLFAEEVGAVVEVSKTNLSSVSSTLEQSDVPFVILGKSQGHETGKNAQVNNFFKIVLHVYTPVMTCLSGCNYCS